MAAEDREQDGPEILGLSRARKRLNERPYRMITEAAREARLRRLARRDDLWVTKSRADRYSEAPWFVVDPYRNTLLSSEHGLTLDEVEEWLKSTA